MGIMRVNLGVVRSMFDVEGAMVRQAHHRWSDFSDGATEARERKSANERKKVHAFYLSAIRKAFYFLLFTFYFFTCQPTGGFEL